MYQQLQSLNKEKKKSSAASFFCATLIQCVCSPPPLHPNLFQGLHPSLLISPLSLSAVVPCVQLTFSPKRPPPLCLYGIAMLMWKLLLVFYLFSSPSGFLSAGLEVEGGRGGGWCEGRPSNSTSPPPPNQIGSLYLLYMSLFSPHCNS